MSPTPTQTIQLRAEVPYELGGQRLDQVAAQLFADHSRSRLTSWIKDGRLTVNGAVLRPRDIVHGGAVLELEAEQEVQGDWVAQDIALNIVYEDDQLMVIDKPAGWWCTRRPGTPTARCSMRCCTMCRVSIRYRVAASCIVWTRTPPA